MAFLKYYPIDHNTDDIATTNSTEKQLWQELIMIRHLNKQKGIYSKHAISPCIDQAKIYFLNAFNSEWRASGLLYYYSFLNLAKAFTVAKKGLAAKKLKSSSIYHGLSADPQAPSSIIDYEMQIHPPISKTTGRDNIFAIFYQNLTKEKWPHSKQITIKLSEILAYTRDISVEVKKFYGITKAPIDVQSLIRAENNTAWFEMNIPSNSISVIKSHVKTIQFNIVNPSSITHNDVKDWLASYNRTANTFNNTSFLRTPPKAFKPQNEQQIIEELRQEVNDLKPYSIYYPTIGLGENGWQFIPNIILKGVSMKWHPLLSDYLFAFILSTILRYSPHLVLSNKKDDFIAEAWCAQAPITTLRYFLMAFTDPAIRCN